MCRAGGWVGRVAWIMHTPGRAVAVLPDEWGWQVGCCIPGADCGLFNRTRRRDLLRICRIPGAVLCSVPGVQLVGTRGTGLAWPVCAWAGALQQARVAPNPADQPPASLFPPLPLLCAALLRAAAPAERDEHRPVRGRPLGRVSGPKRVLLAFVGPALPLCLCWCSPDQQLHASLKPWAL